MIFSAETDVSRFSEKVSVNYAARENESRWEMDIPLFHGRPGPPLRRASKDYAELWEACVRRGAIQGPSIWCTGLSCLSGSSNQINRMDQTNQTDQIPATRRKMVPTVGSTREVQNVSVCLAIRCTGGTALISAVLSGHLRAVEMLCGRGALRGGTEGTLCSVINHPAMERRL